MRHSKQSPEAIEYYTQVFMLLVLSLSSRAIIPYSQSLALHDKHLGSVSAASASCFALGCWNGRRAGVLFITVLFGKAQWKKCLCRGVLDTARSHQYSQQGHKSNTSEPRGSWSRSTIGLHVISRVDCEGNR